MAMRAASSFVIMPPEPSSDWGLPAIATISGVIARTVGISSAASLPRGSAVYRPSMSVSSTQVSADIICATRAASRSLSPKRISSVATVSFSLMTGITPSWTSACMVLRAFR